ncbi:MAG TPA: pyruvate kinase [Myxococcales bacterium]|nr:pyruvate kinase [Myxococcales bacterium]
MGKTVPEPALAGLGVGDLYERLDLLRGHLLDAESRRAADVQAAAPHHAQSARNLLHYLALRSHDLRALQSSLAELGLSSLGRCEGHVLSSIEQLARVLAILAGKEPPPNGSGGSAGLSDSREELARNTELLLGPPAVERAVRIMVTMPSEAASEAPLIAQLLERGMDCMRINCAHDGPEAWEAMIANLRLAQRHTGRPCRVLMDLAGPKLRTGAVAPGPCVTQWHPRRNEKGRVVQPARVWLGTPGQRPPEPADAVVTVDSPGFLGALHEHDRIELRDARGKRRTLWCAGSGWARASQGAWVQNGTELRCGKHRAAVAGLPPVERRILLHEGDRLVLTGAQDPGRTGRGASPARIPCSLPEVLPQLRAGEPIWFDDGKLGGVLRAVSGSKALVEITRARPGGFRLGADKGINLPASALHLPALTDDDRRNLPFVVSHADLVGLSFVHEPHDVLALESALEKLGAPHLGVVLKIETRSGFEQLPRILLTALRLPRVGVMIARGDLAVECGFERLAEVQEEILWVCEAAHVPVIWATQVLETLARKGLPSRAEITDAAMGERAECVMLNKGPHVVEAVQMLDGILRRMSAHQVKKTPTLRLLRSLRIS